MVIELNKTTTLKSSTGKEYVFQLYSFDDFNDLKGFFDEDPALYLFTRRYIDGGTYHHVYIYLGETCNLNSRFNDHHKEKCIRRNNANCIGVYRFGGTEKVRKDSENDLLDANRFPCNEANN